MNIDKLIKIATLEKNGASKEAYRAIKAALLLNSSSKNPKPEGKIIYGLVINEELFEVSELEHQTISKLVKQREESASIYDANSRKDLADVEREQIKYLKELLPPEIGEDKIQEYITTSYPNGYPQKDIGKIIKEVKTVYPTADGKIISDIVKNNIN